MLSAIVAHIAWHWMMERGEVLWQTPWPQLTGAGLMVLARWVLALGAAAAIANFLSKRLDRRRPPLIQPSALPIEE